MNRKKKKVSTGKGACHQAWKTVFNFQNSPIPENCPLTSLHVCHGNCVYTHVHTHVKIKFEEFNSRENLSCQWINTRKCSYIALFTYVYSVWVVTCVHDHQGWYWVFLSHLSSSCILINPDLALLAVWLASLLWGHVPRFYLPKTGITDRQSSQAHLALGIWTPVLMLA